jgi:hypothetical protein
MANNPNGSDDIIVDPARYDLEAAWVKGASVWARVVERILDRVRHQTAAIGITAIVGVLWLAGARTQDTGLLFAALGCIVAITVSAEWIDGKTDDQHRGKGEAQFGHASPNQAVDR